MDLSILDNAALVSVAPEDPPPSDDDSSWLDYAQTGLDVVGLIPGLGEVADLANAGISLARGNYGEAALSLAAMVPFAGAAATAGKFAKKAGKFIAKNLDKADEVAVGVTKLGDEMAAVTKQGDNAADAGKGLQKTDVRCPCFPAGTPVLTPRGPVAIEEIRKGDWVLSRDEFDGTGEVAPRQVEKTFVRYGAIYALRVAGRTIRVTDEHPVYVEGRGWTSVNKVVAGERLSALTLPVGSFKPLSLVLSALAVGAAGIGVDPGVTFSESDVEALPPWSSDWLVVESNESTGEVDVVYNFRVEEWHTYFVGSDDWGFSVWVHNAHTGKGAPGTSRAGKDFTPKGKQQVIDANKAKYGRMTCENPACGKKLRRAKQNKKGVKPRTDEVNVDHITPKSKGGAGDPSNGRCLCRACNLATSNKELF